MRRSLLIAAPALLGLFLAACSGDDSTPTTSSSGTAVSSACASDMRKDVYTQGMTKPAADLEVQLVDSRFTPSGQPATPGQVQKGMNQVTIEVLDAAKAPVDNATVTLTLKMPDHGHGSAATPIITPVGGGKYEITNVWLPMAGLWRFTISVTGEATSGALKSTDFNFCVDG